MEHSTRHGMYLPPVNAGLKFSMTGVAGSNCGSLLSAGCCASEPGIRRLPMDPGKHAFGNAIGGRRFLKITCKCRRGIDVRTRCDFCSPPPSFWSRANVTERTHGRTHRTARSLMTRDSHQWPDFRFGTTSGKHGTKRTRKTQSRA